MSESKHTPGPWKEKTSAGKRFVVTESGEPIATLWEDNLLDAVLIALAPAMLAELERVENDLEKWSGELNSDPTYWPRKVRDSLESVRKVIAQAKGES